MLTLALSSWSFHRRLPYFGQGHWTPASEGTALSILDFPRLARSFDISQIEICQAHLSSYDSTYLETVRDAVTRAGCRVINVPIDVGDLADQDHRAAQMAKILPWVDSAHVLGSPAVRVNTGNPEGMDESTVLEVVAEGYRQLAAYCAEREMLILLENHGGLSASPEAILALLDLVDAPNFRLCPDFGNFAPEVRDEGLRAMLPHAAVVHAKVMDLEKRTTGSEDLERCLQLVKESGYSGPLSIEFEGTGNQYSGVSRAVTFLRPRLTPVATRPTRTQHRVGIVGTGMIAGYHVAGWRQAGAEVVGAADINRQVLDAFGREHQIARTTANYRDLLWDDAIDIVDVCVPPWLHAPVTIDALEAGKNVLVEKPIALSSVEADAMASAAQRAGKVLACRQGATRLSREARTVGSVVQSGVLGEVYFMRLIGRSLYRPGIEYNPGATWFLDRAKAGGGVLYDWGVYDLELLFSIFGPLLVEDITAVTFTGVDVPDIETTFDVEEHAAAMLRLRSGATIFWERGWATHLPPEHRWDFYGTKAGFSFLPHSEVLELPMDPRLTRYSPGMATELAIPQLAPPGPDVYEDFLMAVDGERAPACPGREAAAMLRIIEAVYAAAETGALAAR